MSQRAHQTTKIQAATRINLATCSDAPATSILVVDLWTRRTPSCCAMPQNFAGVDHYTSEQGHTNTLYAMWEFEAFSGGNFLCDLIVDGVLALVDEFAVESAELDGEISELMNAGCEAVLS
jgi:hypothetical protein